LESCLKKNIKILEIGSNSGDILYMIKENNPSVEILGVDPANIDVSVPTIKKQFREDIFDYKFDLIILDHTLEHLKNSKNIIAEAKEILHDDGLLFIEIPYLNNSLEFLVEDFSPEHVSFFNLSSLSDTLEGFKICYSDTKNFLRVLARKDKQSLKSGSDRIDVKPLFDKFKINKAEIIKKVSEKASEGKRIIFYGVSYYFQALFKELVQGNNLDRGICFYFDDSYKGKFEKIFRLPRVENFKNGDVIVVCSNNKDIQAEIKHKLKDTKDISVVLPWSGILE